MGLALLWIEQEQIGFAWAVGIRHHNFRRYRRLHEDPRYGFAVLTPWDITRCYGCRIGYQRHAVTLVWCAAA
jgi:hypothetical protein